MPIYEYECVACGEIFERIQKAGEGSEGIRCPACRAPAPRKCVTSFRTNAWSQFLDGMEKRINPGKFRG